MCNFAQIVISGCGLKSKCKAVQESEVGILPAPFSARGAPPVADAEDAVADVVQRGEVGGGGGLQV